jgi:hypothetical protein
LTAGFFQPSWENDACQIQIEPIDMGTIISLENEILMMACGRRLTAIAAKIRMQLFISSEILVEQL